MTIEVYMDESNIHEGSDFLTVSAGWADDTVWKLWEQDWLTAIEPLTSFHSNDVWHRVGSCSGLESNARNQLTNRAMQTICNHRIFGRIGEIDRKFIQNELGGSSATNRYVEHPYFLPLIWVFNRMFKVLTDAGIEKATFMHENNDFENGALEHFEITKKRFNHPDYKLSFKRKKEKVPLQCADAFAYFGMQRLRDPQRRSKALEVADNGSNRILALSVSKQQVLELVEKLKPNGSS